MSEAEETAEKTAERMAAAACTATTALGDLVATLLPEIMREHGLRGIGPATAVVAAMHAVAESTLNEVLSQSRGWAGYQPRFEELTRAEVAHPAAWLGGMLDVHVEARPVDEATP